MSPLQPGQDRSDTGGSSGRGRVTPEDPHFMLLYWDGEVEMVLGSSCSPPFPAGGLSVAHMPIPRTGPGATGVTSATTEAWGSHVFGQLRWDGGWMGTV